MSASLVIKGSSKRPAEPFVHHKLHKSIRAACLSVRTPEGEAHKIADHVCTAVINWLATHPEVTSHDLRRKASEALHTFHPEASYLYQNHHLVI